MKTLTAGMQSHLLEDVTTLATCWRVQRTDGLIFGFTDHDEPLTIDNLTYKASSGYFRSAIANSSETAVDNLDVEGFLNDDDIGEDDLRAGKFDYATVEIFAVNWADLTDGIIPLRYGLFGEAVIMSSGLFRIELRGLTQLFTQTVGNVYQPECRVDLGSTPCGVSLMPNQRSSNKLYNEGDIVVVPQSDTGLYIDVPLYNGDFSTVSHSNGFGKSGGLTGYATNEVDHTGVAQNSFEYRVTSRAGTLTRVIAKEDILLLGFTPDYIRVSLAVAFASDWVNEQFILTLRDDSSTNTDSDTAVVPGTLTAQIPWNNEDIYVEMTADNLFSTLDPVTSEVFILTDYVLEASPTPLDWQEADFKHNYFAPYAGQFNDYGWVESVSFFDVVHMVGNEYMSPLTGNYMLRFPEVSGQYISLNDNVEFASISGVSLTTLDAEEYEIEFKATIAGIAFGNSINIDIRFLDAGLSLISHSISEDLTYTSLRTWKQVSHSAVIPANARYFMVRVYFNPDSEFDKTLWLDNVVCDIYETEFLAGQYDRFANREFIAQNDGVSNAVAPSFDFTVGNDTVDGGVTWTAALPRYTTVVAVTSVTNYTTFAASDLIGNYDDDYFNWGVVEFLSGSNEGRRIEVDDFVSASGQLVTKLPFPFTIEVGDVIRLHVGCDKTRGTCFAKFNNILNFRGEPDVPGTDQYFRVAGT